MSPDEALLKRRYTFLLCTTYDEINNQQRPTMDTIYLPLFKAKRAGTKSKKHEEKKI